MKSQIVQICCSVTEMPSYKQILMVDVSSSLASFDPEFRFRFLSFDFNLRPYIIM